MNFVIVLLGAQVNRKIESDIEFSGRRDQVTVKHLCQMMARYRVLVFVSFLLLSSVIKFDKKCANSTQRSQSLRWTIAPAKSKIYSPRRVYLSPGNSIVLEIAATLLFIC